MIKRIRIAIDHGNRNIKRLESAKVILAQAGELIIWSITENFMCRVTREFHIREIRLPIKDFSY